MVTFVKPLQLLNAEEPMVATDDGIVTVLIFEPITKPDGSVFTELPMVTFSILAGISPLDEQSTAFHVNSVILVQPLNAPLAMVATDDGIVTVLIFEPLTKLDGSVFTELPMVTFSILPVDIPPLDEQFTAFHVNSVILAQPLNASQAMEVTELPNVTLVKPLQLLNAEEPMVVTELGIVTLVKPLQLWNA